ncbi:hypothetical protein GE09DRAFT_1163525 [Coniochaeta sp. 2T2.1]|nr:hypothetical protein GE09DRAFT_1163525 [Coniochaeta sp. 2T2.1]
MGLSTVLMTISILIISLRCQVAEPWLFVAVQCPGLRARWQTVFAFDVVSEVSLLLIAIYIMYGLQLALRKKLVVIFAFGLRIPVIAAAALHLYYKDIALLGSDPSLDGVLATVCAEVELCYAIVATTIPCLRPFMSALSTNYGGPTHTRGTARPGYGISLGSLATLSKLGKPENKDASVPAVRWDEAEYNVNVAAGDQGSMLSNDSRRNIISKNTEWVVDYEHRSKNV